MVLGLQGGARQGTGTRREETEGGNRKAVGGGVRVGGVVKWIRASSRPPAKGETIRAPLLLLQPQLLHLLPLLPLLLPLPLPLPLPLWLPLLVAVEAPWLMLI